MKDYEKMWKELKIEMTKCCGKAQYDDDTMLMVVNGMSAIERWHSQPERDNIGAVNKDFKPEQNDICVKCGEHAQFPINDAPIYTGNNPQDVHKDWNWERRRICWGCIPSLEVLHHEEELGECFTMYRDWKPEGSNGN